jgi:predicted nucleic acid-binding protein
VLPDEDSEYARAALAVALQEDLVVPALWPYEIQNGLATALRRNRIDPSGVEDALGALRELAPGLRAPEGLGYELRLAEKYGLMAYDAAYLAVAFGASAVLATSDRRLREAAAAAGVEVFTQKTSPSRAKRRKRR